MISMKAVKLPIIAAAFMAAGFGLQGMRQEREAQVNPTTIAATAPNRWARHEADSPARVNHGSWSQFLQAATLEERGVTRVAFSALRGDVRAFLDAYVEWLATLTPSEWNRSEQLAYWINLHNALTVQALADAGGRGTVDRVRQFPIASAGPFSQPVITVEGQPLSIDAIVQEVLRPNFQDAPFHYGLFTGAKGAPKLRRTAYEGDTVQASLEAQARAYVNSHGVRVTRGGVQLSSLYDWYADDFGGSDEEILRHVSAYADDRLRAGLQTRATIEGYRYDLAVASVIPRRVEPVYGPGVSPFGPERSPGGGS